MRWYKTFLAGATVWSLAAFPYHHTQYSVFPTLTACSTIRSRTYWSAWCSFEAKRSVSVLPSLSMCSLVSDLACVGLIPSFSSILRAVGGRGKVSFLCWAIKILSVLAVLRVQFFLNVSGLDCTVTVLYGPAFFSYSFPTFPRPSLTLPVHVCQKRQERHFQTPEPVLPVCQNSSCTAAVPEILWLRLLCASGWCALTLHSATSLAASTVSLERRPGMDVVAQKLLAVFASKLI